MTCSWLYEGINTSGAWIHGLEVAKPEGVLAVATTDWDVVLTYHELEQISVGTIRSTMKGVKRVS